MKQAYFLKNLLVRSDNAAIDHRFQIFIPGELEVINFLAQCSLETLTNIVAEANKHYSQCECIELWFATRKPDNSVILHQLPKGINFSKDIPEITCPIPYWDDELEIERRYILLTFEDVI